jgi:hypothetical protein
MGASALDSYTEVKSVWIDTGNKIQLSAARAEGSDGL